MARVKELMGASAFFDALKALGDKSCIVYFTAAKKDDGVPWCPDCAEADPVVLPSFSSLSDKLSVLVVRLDRPYWKNEENELMTTYNIDCIPTLMKWGEKEMLGEDECADSAQVQKFLAKQEA